MKTQGWAKGEAATSAVIPLELELPEAKFIEAFRRLPPQRRTELLDRLRALREPAVRTVPASRLYALTGLVSLGGDALADTEAIYDDNSCY
jgi:hypothetical protein